MRTFSALLATALLLGGGTAAATGSKKPKPILRLVSTKPLKVSGRRFHKSERVRVQAFFNGRRRVRDTRTSSTGTFAVSFGSTDYDPCKSYLAVTARGSTGDYAMVHKPLAQCPPS